MTELTEEHLNNTEGHQIETMTPATKKGMKHFVAYHNFEIQGEYDTTRTEFEHFSNGRLSVLSGIIGNRLWVIGGRKGEKKKSYTLLSYFSPSEVLLAETKNYCIKGNGVGFNLPYTLSNKEWWAAFQTTMGNFGTGIQEVKNQGHIGALLQLTSTQPDFNPYPDELPITQTYQEGCQKQIVVNAYERSTQAKRDCIKHYGAICKACDTNLKDRYGAAAEGLIHVHHKVPLSTIGQNYQVDPIKDLIPLCPNCHAVVHYGGVTRSVEEVRELLKVNSIQKN